MGKGHQELPGFYYDTEKQRYFPLKGAIPGTRSFKINAPSATVTQTKQEKRSRRKLSKLLMARELNGNSVVVPCRNFTSELLNLYISHPRVWKYPDTQMTADSGLEHISFYTQTPMGVRHLPFLITATLNGTLSLFQIGSGDDHSMISIPESVHPVIEEQTTNVPGLLPDPLFPAESWQLSSRISCLKLPRPHGNYTNSTNCHALITTMGSETCGGSLCTLNSNSTLHDFPRNTIRQVTTFDGTCWTAEFNRDSTHAVIGTNLGAALVSLETGFRSWILRCKSDIFAQELGLSGNVIMCGLRNGAIVMVDFREKFRRHVINFDQCQTKMPSQRKNDTKSQWLKVQGKLKPSGTIVMPSSVCSLATLQSDDRYFLASSMNGSMALYDHRMTRSCPVQLYEGHVNSHSMLHLSVDDSERFVISGGEDKYLRLWNIKSGELLLEKKFWDSVPVAVSWGTSLKDSFSTEPNWAAWFGSREGIYRLQWR